MTDVQQPTPAPLSRTNSHTQTAAPPTVEQPTLTSLAAKISALTNEVSTYLSDNKIQAPSFAADSPTSYVGLSHEMFMKRQVLLDAVQDLWYLAQGPSESIFNYAHCVSNFPSRRTCVKRMGLIMCAKVMPDATCLNVLNHFNFWAAVPLDGSATYLQIAQHTRLPLDVAYRILQHAVTLRIFAEVTPGSPTSSIVHTSRSAAAAKSEGLQALVAAVIDDSGASTMVLNQALERYSSGKEELSTNMDETSFALLHKDSPNGKFANSWDYLENDGEGEKKGWRQRNFIKFMAFIKEIFQLEKTMLSLYDWEQAGSAKVVDVSLLARGYDQSHYMGVLYSCKIDTNIVSSSVAQVAMMPLSSRKHSQTSKSQSRIYRKCAQSSTPTYLQI